MSSAIFPVPPKTFKRDYVDEQLIQNDYSGILFLYLYQQNNNASINAFVYLSDHHQKKIIGDIRQRQDEVYKHWFRFNEKAIIRDCLLSPRAQSVRCHLFRVHQISDHARMQN